MWSGRFTEPNSGEESGADQFSSEVNPAPVMGQHPA